MSQPASDKTIVVSVSEDELRATVTLEPDLDLDTLTPDLLRAMARDMHVAMTDEVEARIEEILREYAAAGAKALAFELAVGVEPRHGVDERLLLDPAFLNSDADFEEGDDALESAGAEAEAAPETAAGEGGEESESGLSHYDRTTIKMVRAGDTIGRITPASPGQDGATVTGKPLPGNSGRLLSLKIDRSVKRTESGALIAEEDGLVEREGGCLRIRNELRVPGNVDFSTGHIEFKGSVSIRGAVKDRFRVNATETVCVRGMVEAATIHAGRDCRLQGGMAAREKGSLRIGRDLHARYLDGVEAEVGRHLIVAKEIVASSIRVGGRIESPRGAIIGGETHCTGPCDIGVVGSEANVPTKLVLGRIRETEWLRAKVGGVSPVIEERLWRAREARGALDRSDGKLTSPQAALKKDLEAQVRELEALAASLERGAVRLDEVDGKYATVELTVQSRVCRGVTLELPNHDVHFHEDLKGPLRISVTESGRPVVTDLMHESTTELGDVARVLARAAGESPQSRAA